MAEAVVSFVAERLAGLLIEEVTFLKGVQAEFQRLRKELVSIQGFLETVDSIHNQDPGFRIWVADVRDIAYDVDDIIDSFFLQEEGINNFFKRCAHKLGNIFKLHKSGKDLKEIFSKLDDISQRRKKYDTTNVHERTTSSNTNEILLRRSYPHQRDDDIIGLEVQKTSLVAELLKEDERLRVVSIYGMGGLGKTTLAKEVYNHRNVKSHFDCYAWTSISQQMNTRAVLQEILRKVSNTSSLEPGSMQEPELVEKIYAILEGKRYLVVLDDIWSTKDWDVLKHAFPNSKGSKIMFTTRNKEVAEHADLWSCHYEPRSLANEEAWELLCKKAFPPNVMDLSCFLSSDMEKCGRDMVKKCGGLPLAIVVLGGLLASKRSLNEWETVQEKFGIVGMGSGKDDVVLSILSLSYIELPYQLKPLFLYLGLFQEDSNIPVKKLVRMWMAESLIKNQEGETLEEVGRRYLDELIHRSMVQMVEKSLGGGRAKTCRLHDKMRDLCIDIGKKENFFELVSHQNSDSASSSSSPCSKLRRCTIYIEEKNNQFVFPKQLTPCLRTAFFISNDPFHNCSNIIYKDFKLLKVLKFQRGLELGEKVCGILKKLSNLRYLEISGEANLVCSQLHQLRHLYTYENEPIKLSKINKMTKLQTLWIARAGSWMMGWISFGHCWFMLML
ncbi:Disease resistance protein rpp8 [Thalictrum thalictroides]|uniref:Disease resistance protein rpp8 n=1 Tax=Thalictrum thalictroides TaxID=46969 RepID=A0A7J6WQW2_THATH|nr:Disease resistance protein rpp8 [Thalictrum thalictroides]